MSFVSYYAGAAVWSWNATWAFAADKLPWSISVPLVSAMIGAAAARRLGGNWRPGLVGGVAGVIGGPLVVILCVFAINLIRYPVIHEAELTTSPAHSTTYQYHNEMSISETEETIKILANVFNMQKPLTFVITAPSVNEQFRRDFYALIVAACQRVQVPDYPCVIEPLPNKLEIYPEIPSPKFPGIVIHHESNSPDFDLGDAFAGFAGCFIVHKSVQIPGDIERLNFDKSRKFYWFELGNGSPWSHAKVCGTYSSP